MIIFLSILTTFESSIIFWRQLSSIENLLEPKTEPPLGNLACPNPWIALLNLPFLTFSSEDKKHPFHKKLITTKVGKINRIWVRLFVTFKDTFRLTRSFFTLHYYIILGYIIFFLLFYFLLLFNYFRIYRAKSFLFCRFKWWA